MPAENPVDQAPVDSNDAYAVMQEAQTVGYAPDAAANDAEFASGDAQVTQEARNESDLPTLTAAEMNERMRPQLIARGINPDGTHDEIWRQLQPQLKAEFAGYDAEHNRSNEAIIGDPAASKEVLQSTAETHATAEKSEFEQFKENVRGKTSGLVDKAGALWDRMKGAASTAVWGTAYAGYKGVKMAGEGIERAIDDGIDMKDRAAETVGSVLNTGKEAVVGTVKTVGSGLETAAMAGLGAGALAVEKVGQGLSKSVGLGERTVSAGKEFVQAGIEKVKQTKERAMQKMSNAKNMVLNAGSAAKNAVQTKTRETVNAGKEAIKGGAIAIAETASAVKERAESGIRSAWEKVKERQNEIKRAKIRVQIAQHESEAQALTESLQNKVDRANKLRAVLAAI